MLEEAIKSMFSEKDFRDKTFNPLDLLRCVDPDDDLTELRRWAVGERGLDAKRFDAAVKSRKTVQKLGEDPSTVIKFVELYTAAFGITALYNARIESPKDSAVDLDLNRESLCRDLRLYSAENGLKFVDKAINDAVSKWIDNGRNRCRAEAWAAIYRDEPPNADAEWNKWADACVDTNETDRDYAIAALKAFVWQVKRKLVGEEVYQHVMVVFHGAQNSGKSKFVKDLFTGFMSDLVAKVNFATVTDTKNMALPTFPVVFCDEMDRARGKNVETIKNAITKDDNSDRQHCSHDMMTVRNSSTLIGCCNGTVGEHIVDTTGMRRFAPIATREDPRGWAKEAGYASMDWGALNELDILKMWQSVDHRAEHPLLADPAVTAEWYRVVEEETEQDAVEIWLRQLSPSFNLPANGEFTAERLMPSFNEFCEQMNLGACSIRKLGRRMAGYARKPWYPFDSLKGRANRTVHRFKDTVKQQAAMFDDLPDDVVRLSRKTTGEWANAQP